MKHQSAAFLLAATLATPTQAKSTAEWETQLIETWRNIPDCLPSTGMCDKCGLGVAVLDLNTDSFQARTYNVGPGNLTAPWGPDDHWEIASITKPFTAVAMLLLEAEGILSRNTSIGNILPCDWENAKSDVSSIQLIELVKHSSGLPAQPPDRGPTIDGNPFANYTEDRLCNSLLKLGGLPTRGRYSYSNYAYGILGYVLTLAIDSENPPQYEDVIKERILEPLQMMNTSVTYENFDDAAVACSRGIYRSEETIRLGAYGVLQGNGALRSTLNDVSKFLQFVLYVDAGLPTPYDEQKFGPSPPASDGLDKLIAVFKNEALEDGDAGACSCVSDWCEGFLCPLPSDAADIIITAGGFEGYKSGGVQGWMKSGDTGGYSSRVAWSFDKGRAVVAADTCGGCGSIGTAGSGPQRAALLLADGPPVLQPVIPEDGDEYAITESRVYEGKIESHNFPSEAAIVVEVTPVDASTIEVTVASSDGAGGSSLASFAGEGVWLIHEPVLFGTGWGALSDPFTQLEQQRALIISADGMEASLQDMGLDVSELMLSGAVNDANDNSSNAMITAVNSWLAMIFSSLAAAYYFQ